MSNFLEEVREKLREPLEQGAKAIRIHLLDPELIERMNQVVSSWKVEEVKEESAGYDDSHIIGFGIPVRIGLRANDKVNFKLRVEITEFKTIRKGCEQEISLSFTACRGDIAQNNYPVRILLCASIKVDPIMELLADIDYKELVDKACKLLFEEDFLRLNAGLPPRT